MWYNKNRNGKTFQSILNAKHGGKRYTMRIYKSDKVENAIVNMIIGSLREYADDRDWDDDEDEVSTDMLYTLADRIEDGTATEEEWLEAIAQVDVTM